MMTPKLFSDFACKQSPRFFETAKGLLLGGVLFMAWPDQALAEGVTLGKVICNIGKDMGPATTMVGALAYTVAAFLAFRSAHLFRKHAENANETPMTKPVAHLLGAGALAALPSVAGALQESLHLASGSGGLGLCVEGSVSGGATLDKMMESMVSNIYGPMFTVLQYLAILIGGVMIFNGLVKGAKTGTDQRSTPTAVISSLIFGAILISIGDMLPTVLTTMFGSSSMDKMSDFGGLINWSKVGSGINTDKADAVVKAILGFVQILGAIAFIRGWLILKKVTDGGQESMAKGITHIIGGAMALNIGTMLKILDKTFGSGMIK